MISSDIPWFIEYPGLYLDELRALERKFPEMKPIGSPQETGMLAWAGNLAIVSDQGIVQVGLVLLYPPGFPYSPPVVFPIQDIQLALDGKLDKAIDRQNVYWFSARHQMANGSICLFQNDGASAMPSHISGAAALQRAELWLRHAVQGHFPPGLDTEQAELTEHYEVRGDVLLGPAMFRTDLGAPLQYLAVAIDTPPLGRYAVTHVRYGTSWVDDRALFENFLSGKNATWWKGATVESNLKRWEAEDGYFVGHCYRLDAEPKPLRSADEFAALVYPGQSGVAFEKFYEDYAVARATRECLLIPLQFPGRQEEWDWLFIHLKIRDKPLGVAKSPTGGDGYLLDFSKTREIAKKAVPGAFRTHDLRPGTLNLRNGVLAQNKVSDWSMSLFGAGALGGECALLFAKAGIGNMSIWDPECLVAGNVVRHVAGLRTVGTPKALLAKMLAENHNPHCAISAHRTSVLDELGKNPKSVFAPSFSLSTIAEDGIELRLNKHALRAKATVYYLRALRSGTVGRLLRVRPEDGEACLECLACYLNEEPPDPRAIPILPAPDEVVGRECGKPILAASAMDLVAVAATGSRLILDDVASPRKTNFWTWTTTGIIDHPLLSQPFSMVASFLPQHPQCNLCRQFPISTLSIPPHIKDRIVELSRKNWPNETGGILIGHRIGSTVHIVDVSDAGPKATTTPTLFERDGHYCQAYLERVVSTWREKHPVDYVGDWHSHPGYSAHPSPRDAISLFEIAADPDYRTDVPVMLIVGMKSEKQDDDPELGCICIPRDGQGAPIEVTIDVDASK